MRHMQRYLASASILGLTVFGAAGAEATGYTVTNLVSGTAPPPNHVPGPPALRKDKQLLNAWGVAFIPGAPFWVADNNSGFSTLYDGAGIKNSLVVKIPLPPHPRVDSGKVGAPTGIVWNATSDFGGAIFIFDSEDGTITAWSAGATAVTKRDNSHVSAGGAVYKGLAIASVGAKNFLYAANLRSGKVDVFDKSFVQVTFGGASGFPANAFVDPKLPAGYAPFDVVLLGTRLWVTYAKQDAKKHDEAVGPGDGYVNLFTTSGKFVERFASRGALDAPWGVVQAPSGFGAFSRDILIGNFGDGKINAYNGRGKFLGALETTSGKPIVINGLWALVGPGAMNATPNAVYFTAGPDNQMNGLFGKITVGKATSPPPAPPPPPPYPW
jgi:uncharacterized protein (TIGR03118 family)